VIVARGTVVLAELDPAVGHEQHGVRPCIASDPAVSSIDERRIRRVFGQVPKDELAAIDQGLELVLGLARLGGARQGRFSPQEGLRW